jgi:hypothetical protein
MNNEKKLAEALRALQAVALDYYHGNQGTHGEPLPALETATVALAEYDATPAPKQAERYLVSWCIDSDAETPQDAAREAWAAMRRTDSIANYFSVRDESGNVHAVDLGEAEGADHE